MNEKATPNDIENESVNESKDHEKPITIIVNARKKLFSKKEISFAEVVDLADGILKGENVVYTIQYRRGEGDKPEDSLLEGKTVKVKEGMIFNVTATDKS